MLWGHRATMNEHRHALKPKDPTAPILVCPVCERTHFEIDLPTLTAICALGCDSRVQIDTFLFTEN